MRPKTHIKVKDHQIESVLTDSERGTGGATPLLDQTKLDYLINSYKFFQFYDGRSHLQLGGRIKKQNT